LLLWVHSPSVHSPSWRTTQVQRFHNIERALKRTSGMRRVCLHIPMGTRRDRLPKTKHRGTDTRTSSNRTRSVVSGSKIRIACLLLRMSDRDAPCRINEITVLPFVWRSVGSVGVGPETSESPRCRAPLSLSPRRRGAGQQPWRYRVCQPESRDYWIARLRGR